MYVLFVLLNFNLLINGLQDPPNVQLVSPQSFIEGTSLSIPCTLTAGNTTETTYRWSRSGDSWTQTSSSMMLTTKRSDSASYTCTATNSAGSGSDKLILDVLYKPDVVVITSNTTESAGSADIHCAATGVPSAYTYQPWRQTWIDGTIINHEGGLGNLPTLHLSDLTYQHSGIYTCTVENGVTESRNPDAGKGHVYLLVRSKPVITSPVYNNGNHYTISIGLNDQSSIELDYYSNAGETTVTVVNGSQVIVVGALSKTNVQLPVFTQKVSVRGMKTTLNVNIKDKNQFGRYNVVFQNDVNATIFSLAVAETLPIENDRPTTISGIIGGIVAGVVIIAVSIAAVVLFKKYNNFCTMKIANAQ